MKTTLDVSGGLGQSYLNKDINMEILSSELCNLVRRRSLLHSQSGSSLARAFAWGRKLGYSPEQFVELAIQTGLDQDKLPFKVKLIAA